MGLQARVLGRGMRKITSIIANNNVIFLCLNQIRTAMNVTQYQEQHVTPGGKAVPFAASVRLMLTGGGPLKSADGTVIGSKVNIFVKKNKIAPPFKRISLEIHFGRGLNENESLFETLWEASKKGNLERNGKQYVLDGSGAWKSFRVIKGDVVEKEVKFYKTDFSNKVLNVSEHRADILEMIDLALVTDTSGDVAPELLEGENDD
jgi:recombination protein RecA